MTDFIKHDAGKAPMHLLPYQPLKEIAEVMGYGASKYPAHNFRKGTDWSRYLSAAMRHLHAFNDGEDKDPESGLSHLAHAACCIIFLLQYERDFPHLDDRYKMDANNSSSVAHSVSQSDATIANTSTVVDVQLTPQSEATAAPVDNTNGSMHFDAERNVWVSN